MRHLFQLESGLYRATPEAKGFFNNNPLFSITTPTRGTSMTFTGIGEKYTTGKVVSFTGHIKDDVPSYYRIETEDSVIQIFNINCNVGTDYTTVPIPR